MSKNEQHDHPYVGMWVTRDGYIRQEILPNGRYDEARGNRQSAYTGSYAVKGSHIEYVDDTVLRLRVTLRVTDFIMAAIFFTESDKKASFGTDAEVINTSLI